MFTLHFSFFTHSRGIDLRIGLDITFSTLRNVNYEPIRG